MSGAGSGAPAVAPEVAGVVDRLAVPDGHPASPVPDAAPGRDTAVGYCHQSNQDERRYPLSGPAGVGTRTGRAYGGPPGTGPAAHAQCSGTGVSGGSGCAGTRGPVGRSVIGDGNASGENGAVPGTSSTRPIRPNSAA